MTSPTGRNEGRSPQITLYAISFLIALIALGCFLGALR